MTDNDNKLMQQEFESHRGRLHALASRMLGSNSDADDAMQETWIRVERADTRNIENPAGWLTTITARVCLNMLRSRGTRLQAPLDENVGESPDSALDPVDEAVLAEAVGLAMFVVLDTLTPAERVAFVLHDMFSVPFDDIAAILGRSTETTRQLASRARRRVDRVEVKPDRTASPKRALVDAFFAAARRGDLSALIAVLHPDVVLHAEVEPSGSILVHGASAVAHRAASFANPAASLHPVTVDDTAGVVVTVDARPVSMMVFTIVDGLIHAIRTTSDQAQLLAVDFGATPRFRDV